MQNKYRVSRFTKGLKLLHGPKVTNPWSKSLYKLNEPESGVTLTELDEFLSLEHYIARLRHIKTRFPMS